MINFYVLVQTKYLGCWTESTSFTILDETKGMNIKMCKNLAIKEGKSICGLQVRWYSFNLYKIKINQ